jgi:hypothetical protein
MKAKHHSLLLHPLFLFSLFLLLLNDLYLKNEFHNGFTGKLSDFTGLFACTVFLICLFPSYRKTMLFLLSMLFLWWKSPLSDPFISFINTQLQIPFHRVIDYSDYIALIMLPLAFYLRPIHYSPSLPRQIAIGCIGIISCVIFVADSLPKRLTDENKVILNKSVKTKKNETQIIETLEKSGLKLQEDSAFDAYYVYGQTYLKTKNEKGETIYLPVKSLYDGVYRKVDGSVYKIPELHVGTDTIYDLQIVINDRYQGRNIIDLRNFRHKSMNDSTRYYSGYYLSRKLKKPIKKKFKDMLKD